MWHKHQIENYLVKEHELGTSLWRSSESEYTLPLQREPRAGSLVRELDLPCDAVKREKRKEKKSRNS